MLEDVEEGVLEGEGQDRRVHAMNHESEYSQGGCVCMYVRVC